MNPKCKHINEGSSCSLNNNCRYPECVKVPSAEEVLRKIFESQQVNFKQELPRHKIELLIYVAMEYFARQNTRLHLEALADAMKVQFDHAEQAWYINAILSDYLTKNKLDK